MLNLLASLNPLGLFLNALGRVTERKPHPEADPLGRQGAAVPTHTRA